MLKTCVNGFVLVYLLILSLYDIKEKKVPVAMLVAGGIVGMVVVVYDCMVGNGGWLQSMMGILPGAFLLIVAWATKKAGYADGIVLGIIGALKGYRAGCLILCFSLLLLSVVSIILLLLHKVGRKTQIPYIPFLLSAYALLNIVH